VDIAGDHGGTMQQRTKGRQIRSGLGPLDSLIRIFRKCIISTRHHQNQLLVALPPWLLVSMCRSSFLSRRSAARRLRHDQYR
jgi:hypothetical protein